MTMRGWRSTELAHSSRRAGGEFVEGNGITKGSRKMISNREILDFVAREFRRNCPATVERVAEEFGLSPAAAADHLRRLWKDRLIEADQFRPRGFKFRPKLGESLSSLEFRLTTRGRERLRWHEEKDDWLGWLLK